MTIPIDAMLEIYNIESSLANMETEMAFREKTAWLVLVSMLITYAIYFGLIAAGHPAGRSMFPMLWLFGSLTIAQVIVIIIGTSVLAARSPDEAMAPPDERDRAISGRSALAGYYVLMTGTIFAGVVLPFVADGMKLVNAALLAIVIAETVRDLVIVSSYRRGWHG